MMVHLTKSERNEMKKVKRAEGREERRSEEQRHINYLINTMYLFSHLRIPIRSPILLCQICRPHSLHYSSLRWQVWTQLVGPCPYPSFCRQTDIVSLGITLLVRRLRQCLLYVESPLSNRNLIQTCLRSRSDDLHYF